MTRTILRALLVLLVATACRPSRREYAWAAAHDRRCAEVAAALTASADQRPDFPGLRLRPVVLTIAASHPHGGPRGCMRVGVAPTAWTRMDTDAVVYVDAAGPDPTHSTFAVHDVHLAAGTDFEAAVLAPARAGAEILRDEPGLLVTRRDGGVRMLATVRHGDAAYTRCEAVLYGRWIDAVPALVAACATIRRIPWDLHDPDA